MVVGVVDVGDVDPVEAESLEALEERPADPVTAEVEHGLHVVGHVPEPVGQSARARWDESGRSRPTLVERVHGASGRPASERLADPPFGRTDPVERRRVDVADAELERRRHHRVRLGAGDGLEQPADHGGAEAEVGHDGAVRAERAGLGVAHDQTAERGIEAIRWRVYSCDGRSSTCSVAPSSTTEPRWST